MKLLASRLREIAKKEEEEGRNDIKLLASRLGIGGGPTVSRSRSRESDNDDENDNTNNEDVFIYRYIHGYPNIVPKTVKHVRIHPSVKVIGERAFYDCAKLHTVELYDGFE